jgi:hypothetical protein
MHRLFLILAFAGCGDDPVHHLPGPAGELDGLRWEIPCGADLGGMVCAATDAADQTATIGGTTGSHYNALLHFRGVVELKSYTGGTVDGYFNTGGADNGDTFNVYSLTVSAPAQTYFVNMGMSGIYNCFALDYMETVPMDAGATITLSAHPIDGHEIENVDAMGTPIVVPDIAPAPAAYMGQFVQVDVVDVATL